MLVPFFVDRRAKFFRIDSPTLWLFSGWNWQAKTLSRAIAETNSPS